MPSTSHILVLLLLLASYALTDFSNPQAHEGALGARSDDVPDFSSDQVSASGWTIDKSSGPELGLPQASTPVIDSSSELPLGVVRIDCSGSNTDQIQLASKLKRSRTAHKREQTFCTNPQFQRSKPPSEPVPRNGRSQTKGPGSGEESGRPPRLPEPDPQALENLVTRVRGNLGKANGAVCLSSDPYYRVPICVPIAPLRFSPAAVVEPARLCKWFLDLQLFPEVEPSFLHLYTRSAKKYRAKYRAKSTDGFSFY